MGRTVITETDGIFHVSGPLDEFVDLTPLLKEAEPLALNLQGLTEGNSVGIKRLIEFTKAWGSRELRLFECPRFLLHLVNVMPTVIGGSRYADRIKSVSAPYVCTGCEATSDILVEISEIKVNSRGIAAPTRRCQHCRRSMQLAEDPDDYFLFLTYSEDS